MHLLSTDVLRLRTSAAATLDVVCDFTEYDEDISPATDRMKPGRQVSAITTATDTTVLAAPADATKYRKLGLMTAFNKHASLATDVTPLIQVSGTTDYLRDKVTLNAGQMYIYSEALGFYLPAPAALPLTKLLAADQSNSTTTLTEVTGLSLATGVGTYVFDYDIAYFSGATTSGVRFAVNYDGTVTTFVYNWYWVSATVTAADGVADQDVNLATGGLLNVNANRAKATTSATGTVSVDTAGADMYARIRGLAVVTVAGNFELWHGSEVAAISTVKAGTGLILTKVG